MKKEEIIDYIKQYNTIIIHHHISPDSDTVGSQLGLKYMIQETFPEKQVYAAGQNSDYTRFLGEMDEIADEVYQDALVIVVDVANRSRIDDARFDKGKELLIIDHHPFSESLSEHLWIDSSYAACAEMIIDLYVANRDVLKMNEKAARCLYSGLITDTGRFYYSNVSERTLLNGAEVYKFGFDKQDLYANIYHKTIKEVKFVGYIDNHFTGTVSGLGYMKLSLALQEQFGVDPEFASGMVNTLGDIKEVMMWIFFVEYPNGSIRAEFRSRGPVVNGLAKKYGGGGHTWASGAIAPDWKTVDDIIRDADDLCGEYKNSQ